MVINFFFEVVGDFKSEKLWKELEPTKINLMDVEEHVYVFGEVVPSVLTYIIIACGQYGRIKGGEFICE